MELVFLGGEVPSHRNLLINSGVKNIGVNFWRLKKRGLPKHKDYLLRWGSTAGLRRTLEQIRARRPSRGVLRVGSPE